MVSFSLLCGMVVAFIVLSKGDNMLGPGKWVIMSIDRCEEDVKYETHVDVAAHRVNRSHVGFTFTVRLFEEFNAEVSIRIDICKYVDGGCKTYHTIVDDSAIHFCEKFAKQNVDTAFTLIELEGWPIPVGDYTVEDYIFNLDELPENSMYGEFVGKGYLIKKGVEFACVKVAARFEKCEDDDEDH